MRDLHSIVAWFRHELGLLACYGREPQLWLALLAGLALWALAYQAPFAYQIDIGGNQATRHQRHDDPFLSDFNASEPPSLYDNPEVTPYRWTKEHAEIQLPGVGGGRWHVLVRATSGRPDGSSIQTQWDAGSGPIRIQVDGRPTLYALEASATPAGDLRLALDAPPLPNAADRRTLGMVLYRVVVEPDTGPMLPAPGQLALMAIMLALSYLLARRLVWGTRGTMVFVLPLAVLGAALLVWARAGLALATPPLALVLAGSYLLGILGNAIYQRWLAPAVGAGRKPLIVALVLLALALRLGGMLHPYAIFSDLGLNRHNLEGVARGEIYFTEGLPSEAGGGDAPYPPGQYLVLAPALLALPGGDDALNALIKVGNALADSLALALIWFLLRRSGYSERAALLGAGLYLLPGPMLNSLSVGEFANVAGQALALPLLIYTGVQARDLGTRHARIALAALLGIALLGHLGVTISLFGVLTILLLAWMLRPATRPAARALLIGGALVTALIVLFYYTALLDVLMARLGPRAPEAASAASISIAQKMQNQIGLTSGLRLSVLLMALGAVGGVLAGLRKRRWAHPWAQPGFATLLTGWWGGTLFSLSLLLFASQGVRWQAFFYPALCLGGGPALEQVWKRGRAGRAALIAAASFLLWNGLEFWIRHIYYYLH